MAPTKPEQQAAPWEELWEWPWPSLPFSRRTNFSTIRKATIPPSTHNPTDMTWPCWAPVPVENKLEFPDNNQHLCSQ